MAPLDHIGRGRVCGALRLILVAVPVIGVEDVARSNRQTREFSSVEKNRAVVVGQRLVGDEAVNIDGGDDIASTVGNKVAKRGGLPHFVIDTIEAETGDAVRSSRRTGGLIASRSLNKIATVAALVGPVRYPGSDRKFRRAERTQQIPRHRPSTGRRKTIERMAVKRTAAAILWPRPYK